MSLQPNHTALYFTSDHIQLTQEHRDTEPMIGAFHYLTTTTSDDPLITAQLAGLRYRFLQDESSGGQAVHLLGHVNPALTETTYHETVKTLLVWLSVIEMVRHHPDWDDLQVAWFDSLRKQVALLNQPPDSATLLDGLWMGALNIGAGIVLEDERIFEQGADIYRHTVQNHIHPEGYLKGIVDAEDATDTYRMQVSGTGALVLMAEMAEYAGVNLWSFNNRGVTPVTATAYLLYYYYYPEKWKWADDLTPEITQSIIKLKGAFIEIVNRRSPLREINILFDEQRPFFGRFYGGLTTLTHGTPAPTKKKRWRLFG